MIGEWFHGSVAASTQQQKKHQADKFGGHECMLTQEEGVQDFSVGTQRVWQTDPRSIATQLVVVQSGGWFRLQNECGH